MDRAEDVEVSLIATPFTPVLRLVCGIFKPNSTDPACTSEVDCSKAAERAYKYTISPRGQEHQPSEGLCNACDRQFDTDQSPLKSTRGHRPPSRDSIKIHMVSFYDTIATPGAYSPRIRSNVLQLDNYLGL